MSKRYAQWIVYNNEDFQEGTISHFIDNAIDNIESYFEFKRSNNFSLSEMLDLEKIIEEEYSYAEEMLSLFTE